MCPLFKTTHTRVLATLLDLPFWKPVVLTSQLPVCPVTITCPSGARAPSLDTGDVEGGAMVETWLRPVPSGVSSKLGQELVRENETNA